MPRDSGARWMTRLVLCVFLLLGYLSTGGEGTAQGDRGLPLSAKIAFLSKTARSGMPAFVRLEIQNVSGSSHTIAFDGQPSSYQFLTQSGDQLTSTGWIESATTDQSDDENSCPGSIPTFLLPPHQSIVQIVRIPIPQEATGQLRLYASFAVRLVTEPPTCGSVTDISATTDLPVRIVQGRERSDRAQPEGGTK
jgi:hypothetical protein